MNTVEKKQDGSYDIEIKTSRIEILKSLFTGAIKINLSSSDAANLSAKLYTPKKKYRKPSAKKTPALKQE